jgi:hypothetical protein
MKFPEQYRVKTGAWGSDAGGNGCFQIERTFPGSIGKVQIFIIASNGEGWDHVSVSLRGLNDKRCPKWEEMCFIKDLFWDKDETVVQYHPPESEYVNNHKYCLHLWKKQDFEYPLPPSLMVGIKGAMIR